MRIKIVDNLNLISCDAACFDGVGETSVKLFRGQVAISYLTGETDLACKATNGMVNRATAYVTVRCNASSFFFQVDFELISWPRNSADLFFPTRCLSCCWTQDEKSVPRTEALPFSARSFSLLPKRRLLGRGCFFPHSGVPRRWSEGPAAHVPHVLITQEFRRGFWSSFVCC